MANDPNQQQEVQAAKEALDKARKFTESVEQPSGQHANAPYSLAKDASDSAKGNRTASEADEVARGLRWNAEQSKQ